MNDMCGADSLSPPLSLSLSLSLLNVSHWSFLGKAQPGKSLDPSAPVAAAPSASRTSRRSKRGGERTRRSRSAASGKWGENRVATDGRRALRWGRRPLEEAILEMRALIGRRFLIRGGRIIHGSTMGASANTHWCVNVDAKQLTDVVSQCLWLNFKWKWEYWKRRIKNIIFIWCTLLQSEWELFIANYVFTYKEFNMADGETKDNNIYN